MNHNILLFDKVDNTMNVAKKMIFSDVSIIANEQTNGRGTKGRKWENCAGNLHLTVVMSPLTLVPREYSAVFFGLVVGLSIESFSRDLYKKIRYKYPNDVYILDKKVCGVLVEIYNFNIDNQRIERMSVGIGVNLKKSSDRFVNLYDFGLDLNSLEFYKRMCEVRLELLIKVSLYGFAFVLNEWNRKLIGS